MKDEKKRLRRKCEYCNTVYNVYREGDYYDAHTRQGVNYICWGCDPYDCEINDVHTRHWICADCAYESYMDT